MSGIASSFRPTVLLLSLIAVLSSACEQKRGTGDQGPCYYETVDTHAEVTALKPDANDHDKVLVILDFKASKLALEDQELGKLKDLDIDRDFIERNNISIGNKYEVQVSELVEGDCAVKRTVAFSHQFE